MTTRSLILGGGTSRGPTDTTNIGDVLLNIRGERVAVNDYLLTNRKIDKRLARGAPHRGALQRGRMVRKAVGTNEVRGILYFLFNPTTVEFSYEIDEGSLIDALRNEPNQPRIGPAARCSFKLIFDRTYEILDADNAGRVDKGVLGDVAALEHLMGMNSLNGITAPPQSQTVDVYFGGDDAMKFGGYFTGASVSMTHFTPRMIPSRLVMDISLIRTKEVDDLKDDTLKGAAGDPWSGQHGGSGGGGSTTRTHSHSHTEPSAATLGASAQLYSSATPSKPKYTRSGSGGAGSSRLL